jgi:Cu-processing system permease protein
MKTILTIARNTFRETIRDKILMSAWFAIIAIILFSLFVGSISHDHNTRIITNFSVTAIYILQVFIAIFVGSMLIYKEMERKTFYLIIPKPVSRSAIIIGKCLGLIVTTTLVTALSTLFLLGILGVSGGFSYFGGVILATFMGLFEALLLILVSILFSSLTSPILAFVSTIAVYLIGHGGPVLRFIYTTTEIPFIAKTLEAVYHLLPNLEKFNIRNDIVYETLPSTSMVLLSILYAFVYGGLLLYITVLVSRKKDF